MGQVLDLLGESVGEPGETSHAHAHGEVLPLDVAGGNLRVVGFSGDDPHHHAGGAGDCAQVVDGVRLDSLLQIRLGKGNNANRWSWEDDVEGEWVDQSGRLDGVD